MKKGIASGKTVAVVLVIALAVIILGVVYIMQPQKGNFDEEFSSACSVLKAKFSCVYQNARDVETGYVNANGTRAMLFQLCQMKGASKGSECAKLCGC